MNTARKIFASALVLATIFAVSGFGSITKAAATDGDLIKMNGLSTVYYYKGGKRYVFPNQSTYMSWYSNFNGVRVVSQSELEGYPLGANVTVRPGTYLVKITTNPTVYAVEPGGKLRSIVSEANASSLWGANWAKMVIDVPDSFFTNYSVTSALTAGVYPAGSLVKMAGGADVYYFDGTNYRKFASESAFYANKFNFGFVATAPSGMTFTPAGSDITGSESNLTDLSNGASGTVGGSGLSVALSSDTPASSNVPVNATRVTYTKFNVTAANDGDVVLQAVTVTRTGVGSASNFNNVYLYDGMTRLTSGRSVNSSTNQVTFNGLNFNVTKGTTKTLSVVADQNSAVTTGTNAFSVMAASDVTANSATVTGSFPVMGNAMSVTNVLSGSITIARGSTVTNPKVGDPAAQIGEFQLQAGSTEDVTIKNITLFQIGSIANSNLSNFNLTQAGTSVATASTINGNNIVLTFGTPLVLQKGTSKTFQLYAAIGTTARAGDTIRVYLDNDSDLFATGNTYGFGVGVTRTAYDNSANNGTDASWSTVQAGQVTIAFQGPAVQDYAVQQQNVELFRFSIAAQSNIEIRNTRLNLTAGGDLGANTTSGLVNGVVGGAGVPNYTNVKFVDSTTGAVVAGPKDLDASNDTTQTPVFNDVWNVNAGQTRTIKVTANVANFAPNAAETIKATLNAFQANDIKNLDNSLYVDPTTIVPTGNIAGSTHNIKAGSLTVSRAGTPVIQTYINGAQGIAMTGINMTAGTGKNVKVSAVKLTAVGVNSCATPTDCILTAKLYDGATQVGETKSLATDYTVTFNNLNVQITKGTTKTLTAKVDLNTLSTVAGGTTIRLDVAATSDVTAQDVDGNSVNVSGTVTGPAHNISSAGTLTMAAAPIVIGETDARLVAANTTSADGETIQKVRFTAANEDLKLTKLEVRVRGTANGDGAINEVNSIALYDEAGTTKIADWSTPSILVTGGVTYAAVDFNSTLADFVVTKDNSKTLTVRVKYNSMSTGARSGQTLTASIPHNVNFEFRGTNSNTVVVTGGATATANPVYIYKSIPNVTNASMPGTLLTGGNQVIGKVTIAADAKGVIDWRELFFTSTTNNMHATTAVANATLVDDGNNSVATCTVAAGADPVYTIDCISASDQQIAAGGSKTYTLKADLTLAANTNPASISTRITAPGVYAGPNTYVTVNGLGATFAWSDESIVGHTTGSSDYSNEFAVRRLPTDSQTLNK